MTKLDALLEDLSAFAGALALGSGHSVVAEGVGLLGVEVDDVSGDWPSIQSPRR